MLELKSRNSLRLSSVIQQWEKKKCAKLTIVLNLEGLSSQWIHKAKPNGTKFGKAIRKLWPNENNSDEDGHKLSDTQLGSFCWVQCSFVSKARI